MDDQIQRRSQSPSQFTSREEGASFHFLVVPRLGRHETDDEVTFQVASVLPERAAACPAAGLARPACHCWVDHHPARGDAFHAGDVPIAGKRSLVGLLFSVVSPFGLVVWKFYRPSLEKSFNLGVDSTFVDYQCCVFADGCNRPVAFKSTA